MALLAAIDQGTTGTRCFLFDLAGRVVASAYREHAQFFPHPGWVEHDALEIRDNADRVVAEAVAAGPRGGARTAARRRTAAGREPSTAHVAGSSLDDGELARIAATQTRQPRHLSDKRLTRLDGIVDRS
jgi:hypothetical protein